MRQTRVRFIPAVVKAPTPPIKDATAPLQDDDYDEPVRTEPKRRAGERLQAMAEMAERAKKYNASSYSSSFSENQTGSDSTFSENQKSSCLKSCKHCGGVSSSSKRKNFFETGKQTPQTDSDDDDDDDDEKLNAILKKLKLSSHSRNSL